MSLYTLEEFVNGVWSTVYFRCSIAYGDFFDMAESGARVRLLDEGDELFAEAEGGVVTYAAGW